MNGYLKMLESKCKGFHVFDSEIMASVIGLGYNEDGRPDFSDIHNKLLYYFPNIRPIIEKGLIFLFELQNTRWILGRLCLITGTLSFYTKIKSEDVHVLNDVARKLYGSINFIVYMKDGVSMVPCKSIEFIDDNAKVADIDSGVYALHIAKSLALQSSIRSLSKERVEILRQTLLLEMRGNMLISTNGKKFLLKDCEFLMIDSLFLIDDDSSRNLAPKMAAKAQVNEQLQIIQ